MSRSREKLSAEYVRRLFRYDPATGDLFWLVNRRGQTKAGDRAGSSNGDGQLRISIDGRKFCVHQIIWLWVTGVWPEELIDHRDLDRSNNRWGNLREATKSQNSSNRGAAKNSKSGVKGVFWHAAGNAWCAQICVMGHRKHLGLFDTIPEAQAAYLKAASQFFGEFARAAA